MRQLPTAAMWALPTNLETPFLKSWIRHWVCKRRHETVEIIAIAIVFPIPAGLLAHPRLISNQAMM